MKEDRSQLALALAAVVVALVIPQLYLFAHTADDAYISFRYALIWGGGDGLVFNPGERVEGFSHPLFLLLLLPMSLLPQAATVVVLWAKIIGFLSAAFTGFALFVTSRKLLGSGAAWLATGLFLAHPGVHVYSTAGLETTFLPALLMCAFLCEVYRQPAWLTGLLLGAAAIARPEAALYGMLWLGWRTMRRELLPVAVVAFLVLPVLWQAFRFVYYGTFLPNTFLAKPYGTFGGKLGIPYLVPFLLAGCLPLAVLGITNPAVSRWARLAGLWLVPGILLVVKSGGDWMPFGRFMVPAWPFAAFLVASGFAVLPHMARPVRASVAVALLMTVAMSYSREIPAYLRGDGLFKLMHGRDQMAGGAWLAERVEPGESIATIRLGGIAFCNPGNRVVDLAGLTNRRVAEYMHETGGTLAWENHPVAAEKPDWIAAFTGSEDSAMSNAEPAFREYLEKNYVRAGELPQDPDELWIFFKLKQTD